MTGLELLPASAAVGRVHAEVHVNTGCGKPRIQVVLRWNCTNGAIWQPPPHVVDLISKSVFTGSWICAS